LNFVEKYSEFVDLQYKCPQSKFMPPLNIFSGSATEDERTAAKVYGDEDTLLGGDDGALAQQLQQLGHGSI
jgi:hypothetical protein